MLRVTWRAALRAAIALSLIALSLVGTGCAPSAQAPTRMSPSAGTQTPEPRVPTSVQSLWMPIGGIRVDQLRSNFGVPRGGRVHEGIDIMVPRGTPVHSASTGEVMFAGPTPLGGWTVWVRSAGIDLWYAHLDGIAPNVTKGVRVSTDTLLGWVGNTGNAVGGPPHLHFEVVTSTGPVDPLPLLRDRP